MKITLLQGSMKHFTTSTTESRKNHLAWFPITMSIALLMILTISRLNAQTAQPFSAPWDADWSTSGGTGYNNWGNGVIQFLSNGATGCQGSAVHETSVKYDPTLGADFNQCYEVFFGCPTPGSDNIGSDSKGDGMAFSFSKCGFNIGTCGGGLGYHGGCGQMITIEFDTYSSQGNSGFDGTYGGGTSGNNDEVAVHFGGQALDANRLTSVNAGNLEDGLEHTVCIRYTPGTRILHVTIDGNVILNYDLGGTYNLQTYFGAGGLNQTWSSGKDGAFNPTTVSAGTDISTQIGSPLCPAGVAITSPSSGSLITGCPIGPVTITASATPPAGNTVTGVEFFVDGVSVGTDNSAPYSMNWNSPTNGSHSLTATAYYSGGSNSTSTAVSVNVGGIDVTTTAPTIDGTAEALWTSYGSYALDLGHNSPPDLDGSYKVMYDAAALYLLITVTDEDLRNDSGDNWDDDAVEVFIDIGNNKSGGYGGDDFQYSFEYNNGGNINEYKHGSTGGVTAGRVLIAGGYRIEARIPWTAMSVPAPSAGNYVGFEVKINDDDGGGGRDNELGWKDGSFGAWNNTALFGTQQFTNCNPLPVNLLTFTGDLQNGTTLLNWITSAESNNNKFIIERSSDLSAWEAIGEVRGAGNTTTFTEYSFTDHATPSGIVYYRLVQVDDDGKASYSNTISVQNGNVSISVTPNPFDDIITIQGSKGTMEIMIYDVLGRLMFETNKENNDGSVTIRPDLSSGAYIITVKTEAATEHLKIIKN